MPIWHSTYPWSFGGKIKIFKTVQNSVKTQEVISSHHLSLRYIFQWLRLKVKYALRRCTRLEECPDPEGNQGLPWGLTTVLGYTRYVGQSSFGPEKLFKIDPLSFWSPELQYLKFPGPSNRNLQGGSERAAPDQGRVRSFTAQTLIPWQQIQTYSSSQVCFLKIKTFPLCVSSWSPLKWGEGL